MVHTRGRRVVMRRLGGFIEDLEGRELPSVVSVAVKESPITVQRNVDTFQAPQNVAGKWKIDGFSTVLLTLTQDGKKLGGSYAGVIGTITFSFSAQGHVNGDFFKLKGPGTINGLKARFAAKARLNNAGQNFSGGSIYRGQDFPTFVYPFYGEKLP